MNRFRGIKVVIIYLVLLNLFCCNKTTDGKKFTNPAYAIGIVDGYYNPKDFWGRATDVSAVSYHFKVSNQTYSNSYDNNDPWVIPPALNLKTGDAYMVQYELSNINKNRLLYNYKVNDSSDYRKYVVQYKNSPPQ